MMGRCMMAAKVLNNLQQGRCMMAVGVLSNSQQEHYMKVELAQNRSLVMVKYSFGIQLTTQDSRDAHIRLQRRYYVSAAYQTI
jgi:hypothetical protein